MAPIRNLCFRLVSILTTFLPCQMASNRYSEIGETLSDQNNSVDKSPRIASTWWHTTINRGGRGVTGIIMVRFAVAVYVFQIQI